MLSRWLAAVCSVLIAACVYGGWLLHKQEKQIHTLEASTTSIRQKERVTAARLGGVLPRLATSGGIEQQLAVLRGEVAALNTATPGGASGTPMGNEVIAYPDVTTAINGLQGDVDCLNSAMQQISEGFRPEFPYCSDGS